MIPFIITIISLYLITIAFVVSIVVLFVLLKHFSQHHLRPDSKITLMFSIVIYFLICIHSINLFSLNIRTILGDTYRIVFDSSFSCLFQGYFTNVVGTSMYNMFVLQAFFCLCHLIYPNYRVFQSYGFYLLIIFIQMILNSVFLSLQFLLHHLVYLPTESYCYVSLKNLSSSLLMLCFCYLLPLTYLLIIYIRITKYIRQTSHNSRASLKSRQKRDFIALRRILIKLTTLVFLGCPSIIMWLMVLITNKEYNFTYRIFWLGIESTFAILSMEIIVIDPQVRQIILEKWRQRFSSSRAI